jgi:hypothetical protein
MNNSIPELEDQAVAALSHGQHRRAIDVSVFHASLIRSFFFFRVLAIFKYDNHCTIKRN